MSGVGWQLTSICGLWSPAELIMSQQQTLLCLCILGKTASSGNVHDPESWVLSHLAGESFGNPSHLWLHVYSLGSSALLPVSLHWAAAWRLLSENSAFFALICFLSFFPPLFSPFLLLFSSCLSSSLPLPLLSSSLSSSPSPLLLSSPLFSSSLLLFSVLVIEKHTRDTSPVVQSLFK